MTPGFNPFSFKGDKGCFPFTWANRSVHSLGKWYAKFRTSKFDPGMGFTICTNQIHLPINGREGLKLVSDGFDEIIVSRVY